MIAAEVEVRNWRLFMLVFQGVVNGLAAANPSVAVEYDSAQQEAADRRA